MLKRLAGAILLLAVMCGVSHGVTVFPYRYSVNQDLMSGIYANYLYKLYGDEIGFNYQLRELTGRNTAGPQWFATVYENYYYNLVDTGNNEGDRSVYRRTTGGEIPAIPISAIGNIIGGFNFITVEENQPYHYNNKDDQWANIYDKYPDPAESFCIVIKNGTGNFDVKFGNPYASHFPYWWHWSTSPNSPLWNDRKHVNSINEPIAFMINTSQKIIAERGTDGNYTDKYKFTREEEKNASGDITGYHFEIKDMNGKLAFKTSADKVVTASNDVMYSVSGINISGMDIYDPKISPDVPDTRIYNANEELLYTLERSGDIVYICDLRQVKESVRIDGFEDYTFRFNPSNEQAVNPGEYYTTNVQINSAYGSNYGSSLGYITFNQWADFARGYSRYRENTTIPLVVANVYDGNAADVPLQFDMTVFDNELGIGSADHVISRVKFTWDAQNDMPNQDFGTFFMLSADSLPTYYLQTQITNRTGTRYRLYRYDMLGGTTGFQEIKPQHWKYDLPLSPAELQRATLPQYFHLDPHSQIAPGLVTVYDHSVYGTLNTAYDTYESFQLSEYDSPNPKNLRLNYRRVGGLELIPTFPDKIGNVRLLEFKWRNGFADVRPGSENTADELKQLMGKPYAMAISSAGASSVNASAKAPSGGVANFNTVYINNSAIGAFKFNKIVPPGTVTYTIISEDIGSDDNPPDNPNESDDKASSAEIKITIISNEIPVQPIAVRMKIPRLNQLVVNHWADFEKASNSRELFNAFARYGTIWLRTGEAVELDANLFTAINNKGSSLGVGAADCMNAFIYDDELYIDFIAVLADGKSIRANNGSTSYSAYVGIFKDDGVPYILIGDGKEDGVWAMTFYIAEQGENPSPEDIESGDPELNPDGSRNNTNGNGDSGGGGGCNFSTLGMFGALMLIGALKFKK